MVYPALNFARAVMQRAACLMVMALALGLLGASVAAALGFMPWLTLPLTFGEVTYPMAGMYVQLGVTAVAVGLCFFLPMNARIMALENSHRRFHLGMSDVARAYAISHSADREGVFKLKGEFDAVRERLTFLRDHPDLAGLEPQILEVAAQMSHVSHELAEVYSDKNVKRATDVLIARQQEIETFNDRIGHANQVASELRQWTQRVELEEDVARSQLARLKEELQDLLPDLMPTANVKPVETNPQVTELRPLGRRPIGGAMVHAAE